MGVRAICLPITSRCKSLEVLSSVLTPRNTMITGLSNYVLRGTAGFKLAEEVIQSGPG